MFHLPTPRAKLPLNKSFTKVSDFQVPQEATKENTCYGGSLVHLLFLRGLGKLHIHILIMILLVLCRLLTPILHLILLHLHSFRNPLALCRQDGKALIFLITPAKTGNVHFWGICG